LNVCPPIIPYTVQRRSSFKKGIDAEMGRRRRNATRIEIIKSKRRDRLQTRRFAQSTHDNDVVMTDFHDNDNDDDVIMTNFHDNDNDDDVEMTDVNQLLTPAQGRVKQSPPVQQVLNSGTMPLFVKLLFQSTDTKVQFETAWALTNGVAADFSQQLLMLEPLKVGMACDRDYVERQGQRQ
jgi:importin subunit alpha-1